MSAEPMSERKASRVELEAVLAEYLRKADEGAPPDRQAFVDAHPQLAGELESFFRNRDAIERLAAPLKGGGDAPTLPGAPTGSADEQHLQSFGDYELLQEVARGGMGVVFKARQKSLDRIVALKMILSGRFAGAADVERFRTEAQAAAGLQHANIVAIHEVGEHEGQHYFSMDYVAGADLAALVREGPLAATRAARYVWQVAEAIRYAHERGTIHRDLKPSNVLIDAHDQAHVTDFGLAKRMETDSALTGTGQIVGTPSYMPPEQAAGKRDAIGPESDVYSLGAILYELLTGRPPFRAETPLDTLLQVIESDPVPPRLLNPKIPRNLETICLKCLQKNPAARYRTAADLSEDLRRFLHDEPILARPPGVFERSARWLRKQRRSAVAAILALSAAGILTGIALACWFGYQQWRLGFLTLTTDANWLAADVINEQDLPAVPRFTVPNQEPVALPAGEYKIRVSGTGELSETYALSVESGQRHEFGVALGEGASKQPLHVPRSYEIVRLDGRDTIILTTDVGIRRVQPEDFTMTWNADLTKVASSPDFRWNWTTRNGPSGRGDFDLSPHAISAGDLNGDGHDDLVMWLRQQASLVGVSGDKGDILWCICRVEGVSAEPGHSTVIGPPAITDVDGDGVNDVIATMAHELPPAQSSLEATFRKLIDTVASHNGPPVRRWVEAVSGRSGKSLWRVELDGRWFNAGDAQFVRHDCRWFPGTGGGLDNYTRGGSGSAGDGSVLFSHAYRSLGAVYVPYPAQLITQSEQRVVAVPAGKQIALLDAATGQVRHAIDLGFMPERTPQFSDLDGDGGLDVLLVGNADGTKYQLTAVGLESGSTLWQTDMVGVWRGGTWFDLPADWPLIIDRPGGRRAIVAPNLNNGERPRGEWLPWANIDVLDAANGNLIWRRRLRNALRQFDRFTAGPDLDGDGYAELFAAALVSGGGEVEGDALFVDALSGADGHTLWWEHQPLPNVVRSLEGLGIGPLAWWNVIGGGPELVVRYCPSLGDKTSATFLFSGASGDLNRSVLAVGQPILADFDGDGSDDLNVYTPSRPDAFDGGGELRRLGSSRTSELWRRMGGPWQAAEDFDGDGCRDLVRSNTRLAAISGSDGRLLWRLPFDVGPVFSLPRSSGDLDGDGSPELIAAHHVRTSVSYGFSPFEAFSGRTGRRLWSAGSIITLNEVEHVSCQDVDGDGKSEIIFVATMGDWAPSSSEWEWQFGVYSGETGKLLWRQPLSVRAPFAGGPTWLVDGGGDYHFDPALTDIDGNRSIDFVVPQIAADGACSLTGLRGRDGAVLWSQPLGLNAKNNDGTVTPPRTMAADLNADGRIEIVASAHSTTAKTLVVLSAADGSESWRHNLGGPDATGLPPTTARITIGRRANEEALSISACIDDGALVQLVEFDAAGNRRPLASLDSGTTSGLLALSASDLNHDDGDELLVTGRGRAIALDGRSGAVLWQTEIKDSASEVIDAWSSELVLRGERSLNIIDAGSGSLIAHQETMSRPQILLPTKSDLTMRLIDTSQERTICRNLHSAAALDRWPAASVALRPLSPDPRFSRRLPWARAQVRSDGLELLLSALAALFVLVIPGWLVVALGRRRTWGLFWMLAWFTALSLFLAVARVLITAALGLGPEAGWLHGPLMKGGTHTMDAVRSATGLLLLALQGLPLIAYPASLLYAATRRRWRLLAMLVALFVVAAVVVTVLTGWRDYQSMTTEQHYSTDGWYWVWFYGVYPAGVVVLAIMALKALWGGMKRLVNLCWRPAP